MLFRSVGVGPVVFGDGGIWFCLGGGEGMEWNGIKGIFLEYFSFLLFGSFNGGNGMYIPLFGSLSGREWNG